MSSFLFYHHAKGYMHTLVCIKVIVVFFTSDKFIRVVQQAEGWRYGLNFGDMLNTNIYHQLSFKSRCI